MWTCIFFLFFFRLALFRIFQVIIKISKVYKNDIFSNPHSYIPLSIFTTLSSLSCYFFLAFPFLVDKKKLLWLRFFFLQKREKKVLNFRIFSSTKSFVVSSPHTPCRKPLHKNPLILFFFFLFLYRSRIIIAFIKNLNKRRRGESCNTFLLFFLKKKVWKKKLTFHFP